MSKANKTRRFNPNFTQALYIGCAGGILLFMSGEVVKTISFLFA